ncbi:unnamed protein product [Heterobilharzia americana]|nr:unnamed protein product [Heterobilharzia americana]
MSHLYTLSNRKKVVYSGVFDSLQQSIRFRVYCHLFIQCYNNLKQNRTFKILSKNRANLILVTMMYLKDNQYTCSLSYSRGSHPWLYCFPYFTNESTHFHIPCKGYYLKELIDFHPVSYSFDSSLFSVIKESLVYPCTMKNMIVNNKVISNNKWSEKYRKNCTELEILQGSSVGGYIPAWFQEEHDDRVLGHGLIDEGLILLDELMEHPNEETLSSLYYFLRSLRVLLETKQPGFFISYSGVKHHSSGWKLDINNITPDLSASLERFLIKFYSLYPLQLSTNSSSLTTSFTQINNHKQKGNNKYSFLLTSSNGQKSVNLTRKQFKQERKRRNKQLKRHMTSVAGASTDSCPNNGPSTITISSADSSINVNHNPSIKVNSNNQVLYWIHLINQSAFELFTYIEYYSIRCLEVNCRSPFSWPPPEDTQERLVKILFDQLSQMTLMSTTQLANIHYDISCWLRAFDLYLLAPYRFKWNVDKSTRLFIPLVLVFLGKLFHQLTINIVDKDKPLSKRQHYLIGRCTGLLTTFLTKDLLLSMMEYNKIESKLNDDDDDDDMNESINEDFQVNCQGVDYDEMWICHSYSLFV